MFAASVIERAGGRPTRSFARGIMRATLEFVEISAAHIRPEKKRGDGWGTFRRKRGESPELL